MRKSSLVTFTGERDRESLKRFCGPPHYLIERWEGDQGERDLKGINRPWTTAKLFVCKLR
jgi:hypothetical protein